MKKNRQIHLLLESLDFNRLKKEAENVGISLNELIRRKLSLPPTQEEIILLRKLKELLTR